MRTLAALLLTASLVSPSIAPGASRPHAIQTVADPVHRATAADQDAMPSGSTFVSGWLGTGAPVAPSPAVPPVPGAAPSNGTSPDESAPAPLRGVLTWMPASYGPLYLAVPSGKGSWWRLCAQTCLIVRSTDAGPSLAMQRHPYHRVADIGVALFERITGLPASAGVAWVVIEPVP